MVSNRRLALVALIAAAIAAAVLMRPKPIDVEVTRVVRAPLTVTVDEEGETRVRERYVVAAPVSGRLERITLDEGAAVRAGDVVARMHPQPLDPRLAAEARAQLDAAEAARREAEAKVAQARAALTQAQRNADRARRLAKDGTISKEELEQANLEQISQQQQLAAAEHATTRAEHEVRAAEAALIASGSRDTGSPPAGGGIEITAPADGSVLRVFEESERVISVGTPLLSIGNPHDLEIVVDVLSKDAVLIGPGSRVIIEEWGGPNPLEARVRYVEPAGFTKVSALGVEEQRVNVIIDLTAAAANLGDNYRVETRIVVWHAEAVLQVPNSALFRRRGQWAVFVVNGRTADTRPVVIGHIGSSHAEVLAGLQENDLVVLHPSDTLADGSTVAYEAEL